MTKRTIFISLLGCLTLAFVVSACTVNPPSGQYNAFAQCLTDKGVKMYGAYWCPHCKDQKKLLGDSFSTITYIECAIPGDSSGVVRACKDAGIDGYPTWVLPDNSRLTGLQSLQTLSDQTGCPLTGSANTNAVNGNTNANANTNAASNVNSTNSSNTNS